MQIKNKKCFMISGLLLSMFVILNILLYINDQHKISFILLMVFYSVIAIGAFIYSVREKKDLFKIGNIFIPVYFLYTTGYPLNYIYYHVGNVKYDQFIYYIILSIIGFLAFCIGYFILNKKFKTTLNFPKKLNDKGFNLFLIATFIFFIIACISFYTELRAYGGLINYISVGYGAKRYLINKSKVFGSGLQWMSSSILIMYALIVTNKDKAKLWLKAFVYIFSAFIILLYFFTGNRHSIVIYLVAFMSIFHYGIKKIDVKKGIISFSLLFVFLIMYTYIRSFVNMGIGNFFSHLVSSIADNKVQFFYFQIGEFSQPSKSLQEVINYMSSHNYMWGLSYLISLVAWIPGSGRLLNVSDYSLSIWRLKEFYPGYYEKGMGLGFLSLSEMYVNFGLLGIVGGMLVWGIFLRKLYELFIKNSENPYVLFIYCYSIAMTSFDFMRIDFQTFFRAYMQGMLLPIVFIIITKNLVKRFYNKEIIE